MNGSFSFEAYQKALDTVRTEEKAESADSFSGMLSAAYDRRAAGETVDFAAFLEDAAGVVTARYPTQNLGGESASTLLAMALPDLLKEGSGFDGSYGAVADRLGELAKAEELRDNTPGAIILGQFTNPANPAVHYATTGQEIWTDTNGQVDVFIAGVGTGGTVSGVGRALKERNMLVEIIAVEPASSPVLSGGNPGPHKIQGIGAGFVPDTYQSSYIDRVLTVSNEDAMDAARTLAKDHGLLVGISSGAAFAAALQLTAQPEYKGKTIVVLLPDTGERYLSVL
jgi:cysteine synthase A